MLNTVFYFVLNMSAASCFVIAALLLIRLIPLPRRAVYPMWAPAFLRLVMPFSLSSGWSLFNVTGGLIKKLITVQTITKIPLSDGWVAMNYIGTAERYTPPVEYKTESLRRVFTAGASVWAAVAAAALITAAVLYALTRTELKKAARVRDNIYRSDMLLSPVLTGIFRPTVILPPSLDPDSPDGRMILAHEDVHRGRMDNLIRAAAVFIACLHWFNPFVWVALRAFLSDMELSCDETVIKRYGAEERKAYASALLRFAEGKRVPLSASFGRSGVRARIINVLNYKKLTVAGAVASAVFLIIVAAVLLTNPQIRG